jgi:PAS domain S-box-containing protein
MKKLQVLLLEDSEDDAVSIERALRQAGLATEVARVDNEPGFRAAVERGGWDMIVSDYEMPQFTAVQALAWFKKHGPDIPFLIVSDAIGEDVAVATMKAGAHDYLVKDKLARLGPTIDRELREAEERRQRRSAVEELRQTHDYLRSLIDAAPVGIVVLDAASRVRDWNPAAADMFGWSIDEVVGKEPPMLASADGQALRHFLGLAHAGTPVVGAEVQCRRRDQSLIDLNLSAGPLPREGYGLLVFFIDVTRHKETEAQLRQAHKMEAIGQLAGGVAHDFNNLLQVIMGYVGMHLESSTPDDPRHADLLEVQAAGTRAMDLTRQLLAFGRRQVLQPKDIDLNQLIGNLLKMVRRVIGEQIQLEFLPVEPIGAIHADPGQIEQILLNLCINARDAMPNGGTLTIRAENVEVTRAFSFAHPWVAEGRHVLLSVADTGIGMDKQTQNRIFEPFFTTKAEDRGTGLGLASVYGIVKQHGGAIHVLSDVGRGSTFQIYLPIVDREASKIVKKDENPVVGGTETILLAEDQESVRSLTRKVLTRAGYAVIEAADGQEALALFQANVDRVQLLLLDVIMPKMHGPEVYEKACRLKPGVKALFCSGYVAERAQGEPGGGFRDRLIQKPYNPKDLLRKTREILDKPA